MTYSSPVPLSRHNRSQGRALDLIGTALARGRITWDEAQTLRELVQARLVRSALRTLEKRMQLETS